MTLLAPDFLDAVVALGFMSPDGTIVYSATGFFIGRAEGTREDGQTLWRLFLVTNSHVFEGQENAKVRINPGPEGPAGEYDIQLLRGENDPLWKTHHDPEIDVAVLPIAAGKLQKAGLEIGFFRIPQHIANLEKCREEGLSEGDGVFVLGFPMGLIGEERNYVIARSGGIARVRDALYSSSKDRQTFCIAQIFLPVSNLLRSFLFFFPISYEPYRQLQKVSLDQSFFVVVQVSGRKIS